MKQSRCREALHASAARLVTVHEIGSEDGTIEGGLSEGPMAGAWRCDGAGEDVWVAGRRGLRVGMDYRTRGGQVLRRHLKMKG